VVFDEHARLGGEDGGVVLDATYQNHKDTKAKERRK